MSLKEMKHAPDVSRTRTTVTLAPLLVLLAFALNGCAAATRPADPSAPRANEAPYPVVLETGDERRERALANWAALVVGVPEGDAAPRPELRLVTATIAGIPPLPSAQLRLPRVYFESENGDAARPPTDEELRESLRRFVASAAVLLGVEPRDISLVEITGAQGGARRALYRQKPFAHPLRNGYGEIEITFTPDLIVTAMSSTAIPDAEALRRSLAAVVPQLSAEAAVAALADQTVTVTNAAGTTETRAFSSTEGAEAREMVVYPRALAEQPASVELRLAWEIAAGAAAAPVLVYVDAVTGDILAARVSS